MIDPIKWVDDLFCSARNGRGTRIEWIGAAGFDGELLLRRYGIRVWGRGYDHDGENRFSVHVRPAQAKFAAGLLAGAGCAILEGPSSAPIRPASAWGAPAPAQGLAGALVDMMSGGLRAERRAARRNRRQRGRK